METETGGSAAAPEPANPVDQTTTTTTTTTTPANQSAESANQPAASAPATTPEIVETETGGSAAAPEVTTQTPQQPEPATVQVSADVVRLLLSSPTIERIDLESLEEKLCVIDQAINEEHALQTKLEALESVLESGNESHLTVLTTATSKQLKISVIANTMKKLDTELRNLATNNDLKITQLTQRKDFDPNIVAQVNKVTSGFITALSLVTEIQTLYIDLENLMKQKNRWNGRLDLSSPVMFNLP